jgi:hypothetical protein
MDVKQVYIFISIKRIVSFIILYISLLKIKIMKKIFTLLFSVGIASCVFAQSGHQDRFKVSTDITFNKAPESLMLGKSGMHDNYSYNNLDRDRRVKEINKNYDRQIMQVKFNRRLRPFEKDRMIRMLEAQRDQAIRELNSHSMYQGHRDDFNHKW